jgi:hypothetical protein
MLPWVFHFPLSSKDMCDFFFRENSGSRILSLSRTRSRHPGPETRSGPGRARPDPLDLRMARGARLRVQCATLSSLRATFWSRWGDVLASYLGRGPWAGSVLQLLRRLQSVLPPTNVVVLVQVCSCAGNGGLRGAANLGSWTSRSGSGRYLCQLARVSCG